MSCDPLHIVSCVHAFCIADKVAEIQEQGRIDLDALNAAVAALQVRVVLG